ncbi:MULTISPECIES: hypothetical protein [Cyanophyceae]|uniref:hypothetical protein n=1 Tax=Cyanophyceae TaxID=3028117 RepID=UPI0016862E36|nr:hypothetical protein [Trichocoleus sp. FACHB-40]MBD2005628.1 hypothetical protein [Trichocoleus sp. FACHB-40]
MKEAQSTEMEWISNALARMDEQMEESENSETKWVLNAITPAKISPALITARFDQTAEQAYQGYITMLSDKLIGLPKPTSSITVEQLIERGEVGAYKRSTVLSDLQKDLIAQVYKSLKTVNSNGQNFNHLLTALDWLVRHDPPEYKQAAYYLKFVYPKLAEICKEFTG